MRIKAAMEIQCLEEQIVRGAVDRIGTTITIRDQIPTFRSI